jgi:hypothetical protein
MFMAGGDAQVIEDHRQLFLSMGKDVIRMGESGTGAMTKLAHNTIVGINAAGLVEGMAIAAKCGIDASAFLRVVQSGGAASKQADLKGPKIVNRDYGVQFSLGLMLKDLRLSSVLTDGFGISTPMLEAAKSVFQVGHSAGYGEDDVAALAHIYESWIGKRIGGDQPEAVAAPAADAQQDRRKKARLPLNIPVMLSIYQWQEAGSFNGQTIEGSLLDVSEDGVQIESKFPLEQDMFVVVHFQQESELPPMTARVIRIERNNGQFQYGCMLAGFALYQRLQLKQYIESKLA